MTADCSLRNRVWVEPSKTPLLEKLSHYFKTRQIDKTCILYVVSLICGDLLPTIEIGYSNKVLELIEHMYSVDHK